MRFGPIGTVLAALCLTLLVQPAITTAADGDTEVVVAADSPAETRDTADFTADGTNDQLEIQLAIDALPPAGGTVLLKEDTYRLSRSFNFNRHDSSLRGEGEGTVLWLAAIPRSSLREDTAAGEATVFLDDVSGFTAGLAVMVSDDNHHGFYTVRSVNEGYSGITLTTALAAAYSEGATITGHGYPAFTVDGDNIEVRDNRIDGTGMAELNDRSEGRFSWGDGLQLHRLAPRRATIAGNTVSNTACSGIWVMWSDEEVGEVIISKNHVGHWGQENLR